MIIRPIKTEQDYLEALAEVDRLFDVEPGTSESDTLEVLTILIEDYEAQHYPLPLPDPIEAIIYHMESRGMSTVDLEPYIGHASDVADILHRRRALSLEMIRGLHTGLGISLDVLIQPYPLLKTAA